MDMAPDPMELTIYWETYNILTGKQTKQNKNIYINANHEKYWYKMYKMLW